jgi:hypothetical protein
MDDDIRLHFFLRFAENKSTDPGTEGERRK